MNYCMKCGKPVDNGMVCEDCMVNNSPWLLATKIKENDLEQEIAELKAENAELRARLDKAIELPAIVMIERTLVDGKFKPTQKAQAFNGRIGVVYRDEKRWNGCSLLVDIEKVYDYDAANARLAELKGEKQ